VEVVDYACTCGSCFSTCDIQSDTMDAMMPEAGMNVSTNENVRFVDTTAGMTAGIDRPYDGISAGDQTEAMDLVKFLSRPVRIANFTWNESDAVGTSHTYSPWQLFFNDTRVKYKLNNFSFIQCKLKIKVLINASPFYYGCMYMGYQPLPNLTPSTIQNDTGTRYLIPYSQRPHIWIYPQGNEAGEMTLPFFYHRNFINAQLSQEFADMGQLTFLNYTTLQSANGVSSSGVSIAIYAWAEDVKLSGPSVGLALQADEYGNGCVSAPATAIANAASWFEDIPIIGKFATATRVGASAVSTIASLFGFTNVPVIADTHPFRPEPFPKMANTDIGFPVEKLTLDPKNELSIDPAILGIESTDEMVISHLAQRESYLCTATWSTTNSVDDILFSSRVLPALYDSDGAPIPKVYMTPLAWLSSPFLNWRGDIIFKFKIMSSIFHKGRLRISYDPSGYSGENILVDSVSSNVVFTSIVDLGESSEVEFRVPYQQATSFLNNGTGYSAANIPWSTSLTPSYAGNKLFDNGYITVRVQTALTAPILTSNVAILVTVRGAENIEFANPRDLPQATPFAVQSDEYSESDKAVSFLAGTGEPNVHSDRYLVNFGESVKSFRQLFRRYTLSSTSIIADDSTNDYIVWKKLFAKIPPQFGYDVNGLNSAKGLVAPSTNFGFNYSQLTPLQWIMPAFVAYRGSTHYTFNVVSANPISGARVYRSNRFNVDTNVSETTVTGVKTTSSAGAAFYFNNTPSGASGQSVISQFTNAGINVSCPNYNLFRMQSTSPKYWSEPKTTDGAVRDMYTLELSLSGTDGVTPNGVRVQAYHAIGTDFGLHFFLNVPTYWIYGAPPPN
jgi:hypothetical protein